MVEEIKCGCGEKISQKVFDYSMEHFSRPLCFQCQKKVRDNPDWEYNPPVKEGADAKNKGTLDVYSGGEMANPNDEIMDIDAIAAENEEELNAELNAEFTALRDKMSAAYVEQLYEWFKSEYDAGTFDELNVEKKRTVLERTCQFLQQREAEKVADSKGEEVGEIAIDAVDVSSEKEGVEEEKPMKAVEIGEGEFLFQEDGDKLRCKDSKGVKYVLDVIVPDCSCPEFQKDKSVLCAHLKAAAVARYNVAKLPEKKKGAAKTTGEKKSKKDDGAKKDNVEPLPTQKVISIDWKNIPKQIFVPKLVKALEYCAEQKGDFHSVFKTSFDGKIHRTTLDSCDCGDFLYRGTSLNPCVHQIRTKYADEEIRAKLKGFGVDSAEDYASKVIPKEAIVPVRRNGGDIVSMQIKPMMISQLTPRLAEIGKIKIGGKSDKMTRSGHLLPEKWDHFAVSTLMRDDQSRLIMDDEINERIGGKECKSLEMYLCYDEPALNLPSFYARFSKSKLLCMGDGECAKRSNDKGIKEDIMCNPKTCEEYTSKRCKPYGRLSVILEAANRIGGVHIFRTTSWYSIQNLLSSMALIHRESGGILAGLPLRMSLLPMTVSPEGVSQNVDIYVANIEFVGSRDDLNKAVEHEVARRVSLGINRRKLEVTDSKVIATQVVMEAEEQAEEISEEFFAPEDEG